MKKQILFLLLLSHVSVSAVRTAKIFSDNVVLQRDLPIRIWGWGTPTEKVESIKKPGVLLVKRPLAFPYMTVIETEDTVS